MIPASPGPILFSFGSFSLRWYGVALSCAALAIFFVGSFFAKKRNISQSQFIDAGLLTLVMAVVGARILHVINEWWWYRDHLREIPALWHGGLAFHGALLFGFATVYVYTRRKKISFFDFTDVAILGVIVGQAIGRWGNYFNEELFGKPTTLPWGLQVHAQSRPAEFLASATFHPLFLYEMILNLAFFSLLFLLFKKFPLKSGLVTSIYLVGYSGIRFSLDLLRFDQAHIGPFSVAQWLCIVLFCVGALSAILLLRKKNLPSQPA